MSEQNSDISAIFGTGTADPNRNPFDPTGAASAPAASVTPPPAAPVTPSPQRLSRRLLRRLSRRLLRHLSCRPLRHLSHSPPRHLSHSPPAAPVAQSPAVPVAQSPAAPVAQSPAAPIAPPPAAPVTQSPVEAEQPANPIEAAFAKQEMANAQQNLLEKKPIFCHKGGQRTHRRSHDYLLRSCASARLRTLWIWKRAKLSPGQWNTAASERKSRTPRGRPSPL